MDKKDFTYLTDSKVYEYENQILVIEIEKEDFSDDIISKVEKIIKIYPRKLEEIAKFCKNSECFRTCYPNETVESIVKKLNKPVLRVFGEDGMLTYCEHDFDEEHILDIEFDGLLEEFTYVRIDG